MKDLSTIEDLRKFVIEKEGERELTLTCTVIRTAIKLKDKGNVTYDDYVTIINRARQPPKLERRDADLSAVQDHHRH